jgi:hypothetical protein
MKIRKKYLLLFIALAHCNRTSFKGGSDSKVQFERGGSVFFEDTQEGEKPEGVPSKETPKAPEDIEHTEVSSAEVNCPDGSHGDKPSECENTMDNICEDGTELIDGKCVTHCQPPSVLLDGECSLPAVCANGEMPKDGVCPTPADVPCSDGSHPNPEKPSECIKTVVLNGICEDGSKPIDGKCIIGCQPPSVFLDGECTLPAVCANGETPKDGFCLYPNNVLCPVGSNPNPDRPLECIQTVVLNEICEDGLKPIDGKCVTHCPPGSVLKDGECTLPAVCANGETPKDGFCLYPNHVPCPVGSHPNPDKPSECIQTVVLNGICEDGLKPIDGKCVTHCPPGSVLKDGECTLPAVCANGETPKDGFCLYPNDVPCPVGSYPNPDKPLECIQTVVLNGICEDGLKPIDGKCVTHCPPGSVLKDGECTLPAFCANGETPKDGFCSEDMVCPEGGTRQTDGSCAKIPDLGGPIIETFSIQNIQQSTKLDLIITVDCSSSMGAEIQWLKGGALAEMLNTFFTSNSLDPALVHVYLLAHGQDVCGVVTVALDPRYQSSLKVITIPVDSEDALKRTSDFIFNRQCGWDEDRDCNTPKSGEPYHNMTADSRKEILIISDDESNETAQTFVDKIKRDEKARKDANLPSFGIEGKTKVNGLIIINGNLERPGCKPAGSGDRYLDFARETLKSTWGGEFYDLCGNDFTTLMTDLGKGMVSSITDKFVLNKKLDPTKDIKLYVNGVAKIKDTDFFVNIERNEISIDTKKIVLISTDIVKIEYSSIEGN